MNSGHAKGALERGYRIAFGDGRKVIWHANAHEVFRNNPNVARPGREGEGAVRWVASYPGSRPYCQMQPGRRWKFTPGQQKVGEFYFDEGELDFAARVAGDRDLIVIEPNTKHQAPNKRWPHDRYRDVARLLAAQGYRVAQFVTGGVALAGIEQIRTGSFRVAAAILQRARLYVGAEGGLHHAAAAVDTQAVVIFGGFISPAVTGYATHVNLFSGRGLGCGNINLCDHCREAMARISVDQVAESAIRLLSGEAADERFKANDPVGDGPGALGNRVGGIRESASGP